MKRGILILALLAGFSLLMPAPPTEGGAKGRKNTALVLGGLAAWRLLEGDITRGAILGAAAGYSYHRYDQARKQEKVKRSRRYYRSHRVHYHHRHR